MPAQLIILVKELNNYEDLLISYIDSGFQL